MDKDWESTVNRIFKQARKDLYYPPIVKVEPAEVQTSEIDFSGRKYKIHLGRKIIKRLSQEALLGMFHHELNHWAKHPYDAKTIILECHFLGEISNKDAIRNLYDDVVTNLDLIINKGLEHIAQVYRELPAISKMDRLLRGFYQEVTGIDFGKIGFEEKFKQKLKRLCEIDFLDTHKVRLKTNIRQFAQIIEDLVDEQIQLPFSIFSHKDLGPEEIKRVMRDIAKEVDPQEYKRITEEVLKDIKLDVKEGKEKQEAGISPGEKTLLKELKRPDVGWYKIRAQRYAIYIEALSKKGSLYPSEISDFGLDDSIDTFHAIESYGKVLPGLAKKFKLEEFEGHEEISIPDAIIIIDSSGSMRNPDKETSYAVLGAFSIARNYLEHGSRVGVINFSNANLELELTKNRDKVYEMLKTYQGGGTTLHLNDLQQYMAKMSGREMDYILMTDAGIDNIQKVVDYFSRLKSRLTIIWIKSDVKEYERFQKCCELLREKLPASVTFIEVEDEKDIPRIAVGKSFGVYAGH